MNVTDADYRLALSQLVGGVCVVTTRAPHDGVLLDHAMTVTSFVSVSVDPLLVLVSVARAARFHEAITTTGTWGISILGAEQVDTAAWFASRGRPLYGQFAKHPHHRGPARNALLDKALARLEARTTAIHPAGDHDLIVGQVTHIELASAPGAALAYHRGRFVVVG